MVQHPLDLHARRVHRDEHHRVLRGSGRAVGSVTAMKIRNAQFGMADAGAPHLRAVEDDLVAVEGRPCASMLVASDDATSGSVMQNAERIVARQQRLQPALALLRRCRTCSSTSMLPVSGALQLKTSARG